jgi:hypothetical protein
MTSADTGASTEMEKLTAERDFLRKQLDAANAGVPVLYQRIAEIAQEAAVARQCVTELLTEWRRKGKLTQATIRGVRERVDTVPSRTGPRADKVLKDERP